MHEQATASYRVSSPLGVQEVSITGRSASTRWIIRREPNPDHLAPGDGFPAFLTCAYRDTATLDPFTGNDVRTVQLVDTLDDPGGPLDALARAWADSHNVHRFAA